MACGGGGPWRWWFYTGLGTAVWLWPGLVRAEDAAKIDSGDTAWVLVSSVLVLMMTAPGLALFYGGLVRRKNVLGTLMHSFYFTRHDQCAVGLVGL